MAKEHELASASPPYERVPNISQYKFNNLLISPFNDAAGYYNWLLMLIKNGSPKMQESRMAND